MLHKTYTYNSIAVAIILHAVEVINNEHIQRSKLQAMIMTENIGHIKPEIDKINNGERLFLMFLGAYLSFMANADHKVQTSQIY